ncbi:hypothetical protein ABZP36_035868 [Zizania latifolia]
MGYLRLKRLTTMQRERRRRRRRRQARALARDESIGSLKKQKGSPCQQDDNLHSSKRMRNSDPELPEDIWRYIRSLLPMRDAARAASVSSAFLNSWRHHPTLTFSIGTFGVVESETSFIKKIDHIMNRHSGIGVKALTITFNGRFRSKDHSYLDSWLQIAVTPWIEELMLMLSPCNYNFPCSLLSGGNGSSIRLLHLCYGAFRPTAELGCFGSLTRLHLSDVRITGDELGCLLSTSFSLERLELCFCREIKHLKIPSVLQKLSYLEVFECPRLRVIESKAPNLHSLCIFARGSRHVQLSFGEPSLLKNLWMGFPIALCHDSVELATIFRNLESLTIDACGKKVITPMVSSKFLHLKCLNITITARTLFLSYDYLSLVSFLDASPSLRTFILNVSENHPEDDSIFKDSHLRQRSEQHHDNLRNVKIIGFRSAKSLVELTCHFLENTSVERLTLDITCISFTCSTSKTGRCDPMEEDALVEAPKALLAIRTYIEGKVPSTVKLNVVEPCSRCHAIEPFSV